MRTAEQQTYIDLLKANPYGEPTVLLAFANGERVEDITFNRRQKIYEGLFAFLEDGRRDLHTKVNTYNRDLYSSYYITEAFTGVLETSTRRLTFATGSAYIFGERLVHKGQVVEFGVVDQWLVITQAGTLVAKDKSTYNNPAGEIIVGSWKYDTRVYTPVDPVIVIDKMLRLANGLSIAGGVNFGSDITVAGKATIAGLTTINDDLVVNGQLIVSGGEMTQIITNQLQVGDALITLNSDIPANMPPTENAGIEVKRGTEATVTLMWVEADDLWRASNGLAVSGNFDVDGNEVRLNGVSPTLRSTAGSLSIRSTDTGILYLQKENAATAGAVNLFNGKLVVVSSGDLATSGNITISNPNPQLRFADTDSVSGSTKAMIHVKDNVLYFSDWTPVNAVDRAWLNFSTGSLTLAGTLTVRGGIVQDDDGEDAFTITSRHGVVIRLDSNNNSTSTFVVQNGTGTSVLSLDEDGFLTITNHLKLLGNVYSGTALKVLNHDSTPLAQSVYARDLRVGRVYSSLDSADPGIGGIHLSPEAGSGVVMQLASGASANPITIRDASANVIFSVGPTGLVTVRQDLHVRSIKSVNNADTFSIISNKSLVFEIDDDEAVVPDTARYVFRNGADAEILSIEENGNTTFLGAIHSLNNPTSNTVVFGAAGAAAPTTSSRSNGTKIVLYPNISAGAVDYAIGIENQATWFSVPSTTQQFKWYGGTTQAMLLTGTGALTLAAGIAHGGNVINPADHYVGANTTFDFLRFQSGTQRLHASSSLVLMIDSDNSSTDAILAVRANGNTTDLFRVTEAGDAVVTNDLTVNRHAVVKGNTTLGDDNQDVNYQQSVDALVDTRSEEITLDGQGRLSVITVKDGSTTVKTITYAYDSLNRITSKSETVGGKTITKTYSYNVSNTPTPTGSTKTVA